MLDTIQAVNRSAAFNRWAGFEVVRAEQGEAELRMAWRAPQGLLWLAANLAQLKEALSVTSSTMLNGC